MTPGGIDRILSAMHDYYNTGVHPSMTLVIRYRGKAIVQQGLGTGVETPMRTYSASKAVTATLMSLLEEDGVINLQDPVSKYLPAFAQNGKAGVTIEDVLTHQAGIAILDRQVENKCFYDFEYMVELISRQPMTRRGVAYHSLSGGYILGAVARQATGLDLQQVLKKRITKPLKMKVLAYGASKEIQKKVPPSLHTGWPKIFPATAYIRHCLGITYDAIMKIGNHPDFFSSIIPAGNVVATADDMSRFYQMLLNGGELDGQRIMKQSTVQSLTRERTSTWLDRSLLLPMRYGAGMMLGNFPLSPFGPESLQAFGHMGFTNINCWADPERDIAVGFLNNGKPIWGPHFTQFRRLIARIANETRSNS